MFDGRYGALEATAATFDGATEPYSIAASGTDLITTLEDGTVAAYDPGDMYV